MNIIIFALCLFLLYKLGKFLKNVFLYSVIKDEYQEFKRLTFNYSTKRLRALQKKLKFAVNQLQQMIVLCNIRLKEQTVQQKILLWQRRLEFSKKMLQDFSSKLSEVDQELGRRDFFHAKW